eukprot:2733730-Ditylum_brightwellii.AAC.1
MESGNNNMFDTHVRKAFALKYSMFHSSCHLFHTSLTDHLNLSSESKHLWLESVKIAVHDFTVIHKCTLDWRVITHFFRQETTVQDDTTS